MRLVLAQCSTSSKAGASTNPGAVHVEAACEVFERWSELSQRSQWSQASSIPPARQASAEGRGEEVERILQTIALDRISQRWHLLMSLERSEEVIQLLTPLEQSATIQALAGFLGYRHFDPSPFPSLMRVIERENIQRPPVEPLPFACKRPRAA